MRLVAELATQLLAKAIIGEPQHRPLAKGLQRHIPAAGDYYWLLVWRRDRGPSERARRTVRDAFGIPASFVGEGIERDGRRWYSVRWPVVATAPDPTLLLAGGPVHPFNHPFVRIDGEPAPPSVRQSAPQHPAIDAEDAWVQFQRVLRAPAERDGAHARLADVQYVLALVDEVAS